MRCSVSGTELIGWIANRARIAKSRISMQQRFWMRLSLVCVCGPGLALPAGGLAVDGQTLCGLAVDGQTLSFFLLSCCPSGWLCTSVCRHVAKAHKLPGAYTHTLTPHTLTPHTHTRMPCKSFFRSPHSIAGLRRVRPLHCPTLYMYELWQRARTSRPPPDWTPVASAVCIRHRLIAAADGLHRASPSLILLPVLARALFLLFSPI